MSGDMLWTVKFIYDVRALEDQSDLCQWKFRYVGSSATVDDKLTVENKLRLFVALS